MRRVQVIRCMHVKMVHIYIYIYTIIHLGSVLRPLLFVIVTDVIRQLTIYGGRFASELFYADEYCPDVAIRRVQNIGL